MVEVVEDNISAVAKNAGEMTAKHTAGMSSSSARITSARFQTIPQKCLLQASLRPSRSAWFRSICPKGDNQERAKGDVIASCGQKSGDLAVVVSG
ncbi:hypothetical protein ACOMHN_031892 [Nucella lapillus]